MQGRTSEVSTVDLHPRVTLGLFSKQQSELFKSFQMIEISTHFFHMKLKWVQSSFISLRIKATDPPDVSGVCFYKSRTFPVNYLSVVRGVTSAEPLSDFHSEQATCFQLTW